MPIVDWGAVAAGLLVLLCFLVIGPGGRWIVGRHKVTDDKRLEQLNATRTMIITALGVVGLIVGAVGTVGTLIYTAITVRLSQDSLTVTRDGQVTDRYTNAVDQLAATSIDARVGGVYALQRVMRDSPQTDQPTVVQVLAAFVRQHATREHPEAPPAADIENAMRVIADRDPRFDRYTVDLSGAYLEHVKLSGSDFSGSNLSGVSFGGAELDSADLHGADLGSADLSGSDLSRANLTKANLDGVADLSGATLSGADFSGARLQSANLGGRGTRLDGTVFTGADLRKADLSGSDLRKAKGLTAKQLAVAITNASTLRPANLPPG